MNTTVRIRRTDVTGRTLEAVYTVETAEEALALLAVESVNETIHRAVGSVQIGEQWISYRLQTESEAQQ